jgi:hypothetical protein
VPPPPDTCGADCETKVAAERTQCIAAGTDETTCNDAAKASLETCLDACGAAPPPTCSETCEITVAARYRTMVAKSGNAERANKRAQRLFRRCMRSCAGS